MCSTSCQGRPSRNATAASTVSCSGARPTSGWITGHSYIIYGIMSNRVPTLMYEGAPNFPDADRFWDIVQPGTDVTQFYTAPTAIRAFMKWGRSARRRSTTSRACRCSGRSASRSTPRRGCGTGEFIGERAVPHRRHVVADRDRRAHAHAPAGRARRRSPARARCRSSASTRPSCDENGHRAAGNGTAACWQSASRGPACFAASHGDRQRFIDTYWSAPSTSTAQQALTPSVRARTTSRRRGPARRGRLLLDHGAGRRRHQRVGPPPGHDGGRVGAGGARVGGGGGGRRHAARDQGHRDRGVLPRWSRSDAPARRRGETEKLRRALTRPRGRSDRRRSPSRTMIRFTDALPKTRSRQDHAEAAPLDRVGRRPTPSRTPPRSRTSPFWRVCVKAARADELA